MSLILFISAGALLSAGIFYLGKFYGGNAKYAVANASSAKPANSASFGLTQPIVLKPSGIVLDAVQHELVHIAGEDVIATKLDLARAYMESGKHASAAKLVKMATKDGSPEQKKEAQQLWKRLVVLSPVKPTVAKQPPR